MTSQAASYHGSRFPPEIISHAVWLDHRLCLSFRDAEDLLAQRGVTVTYETIRQWCKTFGPAYARTLRRRRGQPGDTWYLDELFVKIHGRQQYLWRAVDEDGDVIDILLQSQRDRHAAARFFRKLLKRHGFCISTSDHGQAAQLCGGSSGRDAVRGPRHGPVREQSSQSVPSADARAPDAALQVGRPRAALRVGSWRCAESLPRGPTSSAIGSPPVAEDAGVPRVGCGDMCLLNDDGKSASRDSHATCSST